VSWPAPKTKQNGLECACDTTDAFWNVWVNTAWCAHTFELFCAQFPKSMLLVDEIGSQTDSCKVDDEVMVAYKAMWKKNNANGEGIIRAFSPLFPALIFFFTSHSNCLCNIW
jgi:hypothetical protein